MSSFFSSIGNKISKFQQNMLGPDYNYAENISTPSDLGASSKGELGALGDNLGVLGIYTGVLIQGGGIGTKDGKSLGTKFYIATVGKCTDKSGKRQTRSLYIDNVPIGNIPFLSSGMGVNFSELKGLVPGIIEDTNVLNPMSMLHSFGQGAAPPCSYKSGKGKSSEAKWGVKNDSRSNAPSGGYILDTEIDEYEKIQGRSEAFITGNEILRGEKKQSKKKLEKFENIYITGFSCLLLFLLHRMMYRK